MTQKAGLTVLLVRNGWIVLDRGWIWSWGVPPNLLEAISGFGVSPILARVTSKWPKLLRNDAKSGFDSSGGPKRLDRLGSWLDLVMGRPTQPIGSNFGIRGVPNFGPGRLKMAQIAPK